MCARFTVLQDRLWISRVCKVILKPSLAYLLCNKLTTMLCHKLTNMKVYCRKTKYKSYKLFAVEQTLQSARAHLNVSTELWLISPISLSTMVRVRMTCCTMSSAWCLPRTGGTHQNAVHAKLDEQVKLYTL